MRILIYSYNYHPEPIGIAPLMTELAEHLAKRKHQVRVVTAMPWYPENKIYPGYEGKLYLTEHNNGATIARSYIRVNGGGDRSLLDRFLLDASFMLSSFPQACLGHKPDAIFFTAPPLPICLPICLLKWLRGTRVVLSVQDVVSEAAVQTGQFKKSGLLQTAVETLEKFAYRTSNLVTVIDEKFEEKLRAQGVNSNKIVTIPNWVDTDFIRPLPKQNKFREENQLNGKFVVLYAGNAGRTQPLKMAIEAVASLKHIKEIILAIATKKEALENLEKIRQEISANNVRLLEFQPRETLPEMLATADILLVLQNRKVTNFNMPSKIPVYLASGRAIVASVPLNGTAATAVERSGGGVVVEPENKEALATKILELYENPHELKRLGDRGREYAVEHYALNKAITKYEKLFEKLVASDNGQPDVDPQTGEVARD